MREGQASYTARISAMLRATHPRTDARPIFDDVLAAGLAGIDDENALMEALHSFESELGRSGAFSSDLAKAWVRTGRLTLAVRARYSEDELARAVQRGVKQYVILGAGYDSFAYCRRDPNQGLRVIEVDHPDTQRSKKEQLHRLSVPIPADVTHVPVDFERQSLMEALLANPAYRHDEPAFFSWLGVTLYLSEETIAQTFRDIATAAHGSELVVDYMLPDHLLHPQEQGILEVLEVMATARGESPRTCFEPTRIVQMLQAAGFSHVVNVDEEQVNASYFDGLGQNDRFPRMVHIAKGRIDRSS
jgi:methyltransferase (TIGR00027 family)